MGAYGGGGDQESMAQSFYGKVFSYNRARNKLIRCDGRLDTWITGYTGNVVVTNLSFLTTIVKAVAMVVKLFCTRERAKNVRSSVDLVGRLGPPCGLRHNHR